MEKNIGPTDKKIRLGAAAALTGLGLLTRPRGPLAGLLALLVAMLVGTAASERCPAYLAAGMDTLEKKGCCSGDCCRAGCCGGEKCGADCCGGEAKAGSCCGGGCCGK